MIEKIPPDLFMHPASREIFLALRLVDREPDTLDFFALESHLEGDSGRFLARLLFQESSGTRLREGALGLERLHKPLLQLKIRHLEERGATLQREIQRADANGDPAGRDGILKEKLMLSAEVRRLKQELRRPVRTEESEGSSAPGGRSGKDGGDGW